MCHLVNGTKPPMEVGGMTWDNSATATCLWYSLGLLTPLSLGFLIC